jgi:hypothetical protein
MRITSKTLLPLLLAMTLLSVSCIRSKHKTDVLLKVEDATQAQLMAEVNRWASVNSIHAKMDLKFEDNSFAAFGEKEVYRRADGDVTVERPARIFLKVQVPVIKSDVAQMTSDGEKFRVAILQDGGTGKYKKFVKGTNDADYSRLQKKIDPSQLKASQESVNAFANMRPQHFTDALLVRPTDSEHLYAQTTIYEHEAPASGPVTRGYYLLDEYSKTGEGLLVISRRFWFDRVGGIHLARQQIFDKKGEIEYDILYGASVKLNGPEGSLANVPLEITVTRLKEKYSLTLTYQNLDQKRQNAENVLIGHDFPAEAFVLQNTWGLEEVDLDKRLAEAGIAPGADSKAATTITH